MALYFSENLINMPHLFFFLHFEHKLLDEAQGFTSDPLSHLFNSFVPIITFIK